MQRKCPAVRFQQGTDFTAGDHQQIPPFRGGKDLNIALPLLHIGRDYWKEGIRYRFAAFGVWKAILPKKRNRRKRLELKMRSVRSCCGLRIVVKERASKSSELISRLQELNQALTDELDVVKTKERTMIMEEKRLRFGSWRNVTYREQIIGKFMASLDDLNGKVEENSKANSTLLDENNSLREEFRQKIAQYQEQARISKEMIEKLTEVNVCFHRGR